jgi:Fe-S cluster assembly scaffold protein SufB
VAATNQLGIDLDKYKWGFHDPEKYVYKSRKGLDREVVEMISSMKSEPEWMRAYRLHSLEHFQQRPMPTWGANLAQIDFDDIYYYLKPTEKKERSWDEVPENIKNTFEKLGIPEAERKFLAGAGAQYESESVYHNLKEEWEKLGVIFLDTDSALREHPDIVREYFGTVVPPEDNKLASLNSAVWSGGSFVYVPADVHVDIPLQAYFRINAQNMGQFERTLIICEPGSYVHYVEGCTAPIYTTDSLHSAVVEIIVKEGARCRYTTIQNWSTNTYNLVTKRAVAYRDATMEWIDGNLGCLAGDSKVLLNSDVKPISDVRPGDTVYSVDGELSLTRHKVIAKKYSGKQRIYRLRAENHREIRATANHPFLALAKRGKHLSLGWKRLDALEPGDLVAIAEALPDSGSAKVFDPLPDRGARVSTIEPEGVEDTWDLEIADSHSFVANGFVVHNSKITMKYPSVFMVEPGAKAEILSVAFAGQGQHQDPGGKVIHAAPHTQSVVVSKSIAKNGGRAGYRGLVKIYPGAKGSKSAVRCDALILDDRSRSDTYPTMEIDEEDVSITHEATVSKVSDEQLFYLMSRGIKGDEAMNMIVRGFVEPIVKELPLEYAVELNRLIALEMEGSVG